MATHEKDIAGRFFLAMDMGMIRIVDYGLGNIRAFLNMYMRMNIAAQAAKSADDLKDATKIILPGVGAFDRAMALLNASGMRNMLAERVQQDRIPTLGVCVGMQILAKGSAEGNCEGLNWVPGYVRAFRAIENSAELPLPHMGWNDVSPSPDQALFGGMEKDVRFYFLHSYFFECERPCDIAATSFYGIDFSCAVRADNVYGVQFHPEKSHHFGATLLKNFAEL